jgi:DNA polymerase III subunit delta'
MSDLLLHQTTQKQIKTLIRFVPHALLISGARGTGKKFLAARLAAMLLDRQDITDYPYILKLKPVKNSIGIESVREMRKFLGRKTTGTKNIRRIVIIEDADLMTTEAQNALLKSLEEPPQDTAIILTSSDVNKLLATIHSRVQLLRVEPIGKSIVTNIFGFKYSHEAVNSAFHMSGGRVSLLLALLEQKTEHPLVRAIDEAKKLLTMSPYERIAKADQFSKDKEQLLLLLDGLQRIIISVLQQAAAMNKKSQLTKFLKLSNQVQLAMEALSVSANPKLVISNLILQM